MECNERSVKVLLALIIIGLLCSGVWSCFGDDTESPPIQNMGASSWSFRSLAKVSHRTIGKMEGQDHEVFGRIAGATLGRLMGKDVILIADRLNHRITVHEVGGAYLSTIGGPGRGPGEFTALWGGEIDRRGGIVAFDRVGVLTRFINVPGGWQVERSDRIPFTSFAFCLSTETPVVLGASQGVAEVLFRFDQKRSQWDAFGPPVSTDSWVERTQLAKGELVCDPDRNTVYWLSSAQGTVEAVDLDGGSKWSMTLPDFHPLERERLADGSVKVSAPAGLAFYSHGTAMFSVGEELLVVQFEERPLPGGDRDVRTVTVALDRDEGRVVAATHEISPVSSATERYILARQNLPFPALHVYDGPLLTSSSR